jgi:branched-chain amino acid aminotransferase
MRFIFDGQLQEGTVALAPGSRGLRYGDGLFETMRLKEGRLLFFARHMERLSLGLQLMQLVCELGDLREQVGRLAAANGCGSSARVRLNVFRGEGPLFEAAAGSCHYILEAAPLPPAASLNQAGLRTGVFADIRRSADRYSRLKTNNYLASCMGARYAARQGWDEALLLNGGGRIAESCTANVFILEKDVLYTPPLSEGCVAGVMRHHLLGVLPVRGIAVREEPLSLERVAGAEEVFLTNAIKGVQPVATMGEHAYAVRFSRQVHAWAESSAW